MRHEPPIGPQLISMVLEAWQRTEQFHSEWIAPKGITIPTNEAGMKPVRREDLFLHVFARRGESFFNFPKKKEARISPLRGPGAQTTSECEESRSGQEILESFRFC